MKQFWNKNGVALALLALVVFAVFGRTVWFDYVQLDEGIILTNNWLFVSDISNFFEVFKHDINYPSNVAPYYRPMFIASFMLNSQFGSSPMVFHLGSIFLHIAAAYFVFWLFRELGFKKEISLFSALLFAVHPAVTPVVAWVPGRIEAILAIFTALSFILFIRFLRSGGWMYMAGFLLSFTAAILTKEVALALIPILFFYYLMHRKEKGGEMLVTLASGLAAMILVWFFVRKSILAGAQVVDMSFWQMLAVLWSNSASVVLYLGKTILPFNLTALPILENSTLLFGFAVLAGLAAYWLIGKMKFLSLSTLGLLWFVAFLAPSLVGFYPTERMIFFEHRLYLPLAGIFIFFASSDWVNRLDFKQVKVLMPVIAVTILFLVLAFNYSGIYKDRFSFWQKAAADSPQTPQAHKGLATAYLMDGKSEEAKAEFAKTLELNPKEKGVHLLLGLYYLDQSRYNEAKEELEKEIETDPGQFIAHHSLGWVYAQRSNYKEAEKYFLKTIEINPDYVLARQDLVVLYFSQNKHSQAVAQLKELLRIQRPEAMHPQILKILEIYTKETALRQQGF